jgi:D-3-phosphoglycerate dehydrogenase
VNATPLTVLVTPHRFRDLAPERTVLEPLSAQIVEAQDSHELALRAGDADALLVTSAPVDAALIGRLGRCRAIVRYGIGVEGIDLAAATGAGIPVGNVIDASVHEVADHSVATALTLLRRLDAASAVIAAGGWTLEPMKGVRRLSALTAGVLGLGRIGRAVASRLSAFGMSVIAYDPFVADAPWPLVDLETLLEEADVVTVHLPLTDGTRNLLSRDALSRMRPNAIVVNVARGGIVDEHALAEALLAGRLAGAAVDVFQNEPLPEDHPLRRAPNTLLTPHVAWYSEESLREVQRKAAEQVARALRGDRLEPIVNPDVYTDRSEEDHA